MKAILIDDELLVEVLAVLFTLDPVLTSAEIEAIAAVLRDAGFFTEQ